MFLRHLALTLFHHSTSAHLILSTILLLVPSLCTTATAQSSCDQDASEVSYLFLGGFPGCQIQSSTQVPVGNSTLITVSVSILTTPISRVRISIQDPPVGTILSETWAFPHVGARNTGIELDLQGCSQTGGLLLGELLIQIPSSLATCSFWRIDSGAEVDDCNGQTRQLAPWHQYLNTAQDCTASCGSWQWCALMPPSDLSPADGATDLLLETQPIADGQYLGNLWITDDATCSAFEPFFPSGNQPWLPDGYLQPGKTYHWYVEYTPGACSNVGGTRSKTRSFSTRDPVSLMDQPWSSIKKLFR